MGEGVGESKGGRIGELVNWWLILVWSEIASRDLPSERNRILEMEIGRLEVCG